MATRNLQEMYQRVTGRRFGVALETVDETRAFTVLVTGPRAAISRIVVTDLAAGISYEVYPAGQQAFCTPRIANLKVECTILNIGGAGTLFWEVIDDTGKTVYGPKTNYVGGGASWTDFFTIDMPFRDYKLTINVGH
jgi:hypothetical protein